MYTREEYQMVLQALELYKGVLKSLGHNDKAKEVEKLLDELKNKD